MTKPDQLTRADLTRMTPAEIETARAEGRCAVLLGDPTGGAIGLHDLSRMSGPQVLAAQKAGRLDHLLNPPTDTDTKDA